MRVPLIGPAKRKTATIAEASMQSRSHLPSPSGKQAFCQSTLPAAAAFCPQRQPLVEQHLVATALLALQASHSRLQDQKGRVIRSERQDPHPRTGAKQPWFRFSVDCACCRQDAAAHQASKVPLLLVHLPRHVCNAGPRPANAGAAAHLQGFASPGLEQLRQCPGGLSSGR